ncbi:MAG: SDR family oxidoreductase [Acidimicrobiales bacterium]|nr:SDR family oxidoreductase [Acidimicrobiales bacterium]
MGLLDGRVAIVTGGAQGMGAAHCRRFVAEGATVVIADVADELGQALADELGDAAHYVHLDVSSEQEWADAVALAAGLGPLRVLVNNAAIHWLAPIVDETVEGLRRILDVNLVGTFIGIRSVVDPMTAAGGGSIINISSIAGLTGLDEHGAYGASKWGVRGLTKVAAVELGPVGIRVHSVHPGPIESGMLPADRHGHPEFFTHLPLQRAGSPEEVADLVSYLASDQSSYQTGGEYVVDGGSVAGRRRT